MAAKLAKSRGAARTDAARGQNMAPPATLTSRLQEAARATNASDNSKAERILVEVLEEAPGHPDAVRLYGGILRKSGRLDEALALLREAASDSQASGDIHVGLGLVYRDLGNADQAIASFERAFEIDNRSWYALCNLGTILRETGRFDEACESFVAALKLNPSLPEAWNGLARSARYHEAPPFLDDIKVVAETAHPAEFRVQALYALAKILDDIGEFPDAFAYAERANAADTQRSAIDLGPSFLDRIGEYFDDARSQGMPRLTLDDIESGPAPIFVLGMPRSGTTLLEQFFAAHPDAFGGGETNFFGDWAHTTADRTARPDQYPLAVDSLRIDGLKDMRKRFLARFNTQGKMPLCLIDRTPFNYAYLPVIAAALPDARVVHLMRDDFDRGVSIFMNQFAPVYPFTRSLVEIGRYTVAYRRLMDRWRDADLLPLLDVCYEEFVSDPEAGGRRILEFCGLDWDERCLHFYRSNRLVTTASDWQVRQPMYTSSIGRGESYKAFLGPLRDTLNEQGA